MKMSRPRKILFAQIAVIVSIAPAVVSANIYGPAPGYAGVFNEGVCNSCHYNNGDPAPAGSGVKVDFPNGLTYAPGVRQHLVVTVTDPAMSSWGFQLTARRVADNKSQAGFFTPGSDGFTQVVCASKNLEDASLAPCSSLKPLQYIEHTSTGTRGGTKGPMTFEFDWTPPDTNVGPVMIFVEAVAANNDYAGSGDRIYYQRYTLTKNNQPSFMDGGVFSGASFQPGICAGSWLSVQGLNLANTTRSWRADEIVGGVLPTTLDGVSVTVNDKPAYLSYISPAQINLQSPSDDALGKVNVTVTNNGVSTTTFADLQPVCPAFFQWTKYTVATRPDFSLVGPANLFPGANLVPAKPGEVIILWGTGFGSTNPAVQAGQLAPVTQLSSVVTLPIVRIANMDAPVIAGALTPGFAGLYQVAVKVPDAAPNGDQPVVTQLGGYSSPDGVYLTIQR